MGKSLSRRAFIAGALGLAAVGAVADVSRNAPVAVFPEYYGAVGDGASDDTGPIQAAFDSGFDVKFVPARRYLVTKALTTEGGKTIDFNGATLDCPDLEYVLRNSSMEKDAGIRAYDGHGDLTICNGTVLKGSLLLSHAANVTLENMAFKDCAHNHWVQICAMKDLVIRGCTFAGMKPFENNLREYINFDPALFGAFPYFKNGSATFDGTVCDGVTITGCRFEQGDSKEYSGGYVGVGSHITGAKFKHENVVITGNLFSGLLTTGITVNSMDRVLIAENVFEGMDDSIKIAGESDVSNVVIEGNVLCSRGNLDAVRYGSCKAENVSVRNNKEVKAGA